MKRGLIFDIRRFSTHDGDGIRTTIFFKGCPLSCVWCQNPEGIPQEQRVLYFKSRCIKCLECVKHAKDNGVTFENGEIILHPNANEDWNRLVDICPSMAINFDSSYYTIDEIMEEALKDRPFYKYGGGVTLSGGEPLMQSEFAIELLKRLHELGINTAIETALFVSTDVIKNALPYIDQLYVDFKLFDTERHHYSVGVPNERIMENIKFILESEKREKLIVRTPLIPSYTALEENIAAIAGYISSIYPDVHYELLNYNPLAEAKYHLVNREYCFKENPGLYTKEEMKAFGAIAINHGIKNLILEI